MSDLRHPPDGAEAIDPESDDFVSQFDRQFGTPGIDPNAPAPPPPPPGAETAVGNSDAAAAGAGFVPFARDAASGEPPTEPSAQLFPERFARRVIRRPYEWMKRPWPDDRVVQVATTIACLVVTTFIMMKVVHWDPLSARADLVGDDTTPTGGDMGSHVWGPAFLRDHLLPNGQLSGWSMDWYGGLPVYRFYMVIPALMIVALDALPGIAYGVAFKYVVIAGLVTMPVCCWAFGRLARFRYPMPELFAFAGLCFALNESYAIYGGNVKSTMAGEFSFSIAISLMMLGWGLLARGIDEGKYRSWAAVILSLACLSHGIVLIYTIIGALAIVGCRLFADLWRARGTDDPAAMTLFVRRLIYSGVVGGLTILLSAFWVVPFVLNHSYMTDMKYGSRPEGPTDSFWDMFFDQFVAFDLLINVLAIIGFAFLIMRRHVHGIALGITGLVAVALVYLTQDSLPVIGLLWNPRVLPLVYLVRYVLMMVGAVEVLGIAFNLVRNRRSRELPTTGFSALSLGTVGLVVLIIFGWAYQELPFDGQRTVHGQVQYAWGPFRGSHGAAGNGDASGDGWSRYNFLGYEGRELYPEYYDVVQTMDRIGQEDGCGRALWENNGRDTDGNGRYGTTMALMLLPFWTDGCIGSMEGLFFEASGSTPYMFLTAGAMSRQSSNPVRELRYVNNDAAVGVDHLQALGVRYVMVHTSEAVNQADAQVDLALIAKSGPWRIYQVNHSDVVVPLEVQPVVVNGRGGDQRERYLELGTSWFQNQDEWAAMPANDGPDVWQRIDVEVDQSQEVPDPTRPLGTIDNPETAEVEAADTRGRLVSIVQPVQEIEIVEEPAIEVTNVDIEQQSLSFDVSQIGVPVLVRVSYFPNWSVDGAEGPYRIGANQMVVVPTDTHVKLHYDRSNLDLAAYGLTIIGVVLALFLRLRGDTKYPILVGDAPVGGGGSDDDLAPPPPPPIGDTVMAGALSPGSATVSRAPALVDADVDEHGAFDATPPEVPRATDDEAGGDPSQQR